MGIPALLLTGGPRDRRNTGYFNNCRSCAESFRKSIFGRRGQAGMGFQNDTTRAVITAAGRR